MKDVWTVEVMYHEDVPAVYGPYTKRQADKVAERLNMEVKLTDANSQGVGQHPRNVRYAVSFPLRRYDDFLSASDYPARDADFTAWSASCSSHMGTVSSTDGETGQTRSWNDGQGVYGGITNLTQG